MNQQAKIIWYFVLFMASCLQSVSGSHCDQNHFWDDVENVCRQCSLCPLNQIIRAPCSKYTDIVCWPFREFSDFNQFNGFAPSYPLEYDRVSTSQTGRTFGENRRQATQNAGVMQNEPMIEKEDGEYWKNLAFALIGVVCILIIVATIIVLLACRKLHESSNLKKPEEDDDDDSGYVVIRSIRPASSLAQNPRAWSSVDFSSSPAALSLLPPESACDFHPIGNKLAHHNLRFKGIYKPKRRLLNYDADDVFESEDSGGSRSSRKMPLQTIPERSFSDSDNQPHCMIHL